MKVLQTGPQCSSAEKEKGPRNGDPALKGCPKSQTIALEMVCPKSQTINPLCVAACTCGEVEQKQGSFHAMNTLSRPPKIPSSHPNQPLGLFISLLITLAVSGLNQAANPCLKHNTTASQKRNLQLGGDAIPEAASAIKGWHITPALQRCHVVI